LELQEDIWLIVNELYHQQSKIHFSKGNKGQINVDFHTKDDSYEFTVKDNGIGFPEYLDYQNTDSLGLQLINSLTSQIDGEIELDRNNGTEFKIKFIEVNFWLIKSNSKYWWLLYWFFGRTIITLSKGIFFFNG
jgi:two-component sensor histidine kinase